MEKEISIDLIDLPSYDLRFYRSSEFFELLCSDISKEGILVKPIVTPVNGRFQVIDGVNRVKCAQKLGWKTVTCAILAIDENLDKLILGLKTNLFRKTHDIMGIVNVFSYLRDNGMKQKEISKRFNVSKSYVSKLLSLTRLSSNDKLRLAKGQITVPHAYQMVKRKRNPELMEKLGIKYRCDTCNSQVSFHERELVSLCSSCRSKLEKMLRRERKKSLVDLEQTELKS